MSPYNADVIKQMVSEAIKAGPRGIQTRLAEATGVNVQTVNKWAQQQTAPELHRWPTIESFFGWEPGTMVEASGIQGRSLLHLSDLHLQLPPDFVFNAGDQVIVVVVDRGEPITKQLIAAAGAQRPGDRRASGKSLEPGRRLREMLGTGDVVRVKVEGSDAEVYAIRPMPEELPAAAEKGKATGARKAPARRPKPKTPE